MADTETQVDDSVCVLCGTEITDYGNNPDPVAQNGRCCDHCNSTKVIPARLEQARKLSQES